jgi:hypothetical protein
LRVRRFNDSDHTIIVPLTATDKADTVVVLEVQGDMQSNPVRLLAARNQPNVLRTFDGELHGAGLRFGDGKAARAYVMEWRDPKEWVGWQVRANEVAEYEVSLKYTTASKENSGCYSVSIGQQTLQAVVVPTTSEPTAATVTLGRVKLGPGKHEVAVKPVEIKGGELMRLFHVTLTPVAVK